MQPGASIRDLSQRSHRSFPHTPSEPVGTAEVPNLVTGRLHVRRQMDSCHPRRLSGSLGPALPACVPCSASCGHLRAHSLPPSPRPWPKSILGCVKLGAPALEGGLLGSNPACVSASLGLSFLICKVGISHIQSGSWLGHPKQKPAEGLISG